MGEVVDLFSRARVRIPVQRETSELQVQHPAVAASFGTKEIDFEAIAKQNADLQEKLRKERVSANKNVLKSYRIK